MKREIKDFIIEQIVAGAIVIFCMAIGWAVCVVGLWILGVL